MSLKALVYAYVIGGFTFIPLLLVCAIFYTAYTSVPVPDPNDPTPRGTEDIEEKDSAATLASPPLRAPTYRSLRMRASHPRFGKGG